MATKFEKNPVDEAGVPDQGAHFAHAVLDSEVDRDAALPKGQVDPVYEAKARVLNAAVPIIYSSLSLA